MRKERKYEEEKDIWRRKGNMRNKRKYREENEI